MRTSVPLVVMALAAATGCARMGPLGQGLGTTLSRDARGMTARTGPGYPGPHAVDAIGMRPQGASFPIVLYRPRDLAARAPAVIFLPGRFAPEDQYESYGRLLASHGFVVAIRGIYGAEYPDSALVRDTRWLVDWLGRQPNVDGSRIGIAGHSMGGRDAITAALGDGRVRAVVSIDPGGATSYPVIYEDTRRLEAPLLLIGAEVAWRGAEVCAPKETNYQRFFAQSRPGTVELTLRGADHMQVMDEPDRFGQWICRVGTADSTAVRVLSRAATVQFFQEHLIGAPPRPYADGVLAVARVRPVPGRPQQQPVIDSGPAIATADRGRSAAATTLPASPAREVRAPVQAPAVRAQ